MLRRAKKHQKNLARLVLATLLCTGAADGIISPPVAEAAGSITVTGYSSGQFIPDGSMVTIYDSGYYTAYPADGSVTVLNIAPGETDTWEGGNKVYVYGHYVKGASGDTPMDASGYTVKMTGAKAQVNYLTGGYAENSVTIDVSGGTNDTGNVTAAANENTVTISGEAAVSEDVIGGHAFAYAYAYYGATNTAGATASASKNTVTITGASVNGDVYGGTAYGYAYAYGGTTNTSETTVEASNNTITIGKDANVGDDIFGGYTGSDVDAYAYVESASGITATAEGTTNTNYNTITISDNAVVGEDVYGGYNYTYIYAYGYDAGTATAEGTVNANNNTITISDNAKVGEKIYGGYNTTYVYSYAYNAGIGTAEGTVNANNNTITISDNAEAGNVYGGLNYTYTYAYVSIGSATAEETSGSATAEETSNANNNTITISDNAKAGSVYGGLNYFYVYYTYAYGGDTTVTGTANANKNTITISGTAEVGEVYGGYNYAYAEYGYAYDSGDKATVEITASASENTIAISDKAVVSNDVYGGYNKSYAYYIYTYYGEIAVDLTGSANKNTVTISGDTSVAGSVYGGYNDSYAYYIYAYYSGSSATAGTNSDASENEVTISGATVTGGVYGGYNTNETYVYAYDTGSKSTVEVTANADKNTVTIDSAASVGKVYGGYVEVEAYSSAYYAESTNTVVATASENEVTVSAASVSNDVYGGSIYSYAYYGNKVSADLAANANTITVSDATVGGGVYGGDVSGYAYAYSFASAVLTATGTSTASENEVTISDATVGGNVYGGNAGIEAYGYTYDADYDVEANATADASNNLISISEGASVSGDVYAGYAYAKADATNGATNIAEATASASSNTITINGASVSGDVYGGYAYAATSDGGTATATANKNTVNLQDAAISGSVYGGNSANSDGADVVTGNTLVISGVNTAGGKVTNFETIKLAETLEWNTEAPVLTANQFADNADGTRAALDVSDVKDDFAPAEGGQMTILASETTDDFATLALTYSGGSETLNESKQSQVVKDEPISDEEKGVAVVIQTVHTVSLDEDNSYKNVLYSVENETKGIALKEMKWGEGRDLKGKYTFDDTMTVDATDLTFTGAATTALKAKDSMALATNATGLTTANKVTEGTDKTVSVDHTDANGINFGATATGHVESAKNAVNYVVDSVALDSVDLAGWKGTASAVPEGWTAAANVSVETDGMTAPAVEVGKQVDILQGGAADFFANATINGANAYKDVAFTDTDPSKTVTVSGTQGKGVKTSEDGADLVYAAGKKNADTVKAGALKWQKDAVLFDGSDGYDYTKVASIGTDSFEVTYGDGVPETIAAGDSMTLLKANKTLKDMAAAEKKNSYSYEPVSGVTVDAAVTGKLAVKDGVLTYTAAENRADKLTFGDVQWSAGSPLLKRPSNIIFAGADVDTAKINFVNMSYLDANQKMTLVSDFGDSVGTITGSKYMVGTAFEGEGTASLKGSDLIFTTKTEAGLSEQTHKTVMAMDAGLAMLKTGNEFVGKAIDGLADVRNRGKDGVSTFASVGGGASRYSTGSHVNTHTWNAVVGVGKKTETKQGTVEYGIFGEYGKGSYTLHSNAGNGDGDAHHAGGGVLAKFTNKHNVYAEGSIRAGRMSDSSSDIMRDGLGNAYGYDVHASYYGAHLGAGKIINYKGGKSLDVYGKFFYLKRDGVEYDAVQHYNLDSVSSSILRLGARYGTTDKKWNWYGGLAYEYEFDGEAKGTVNGKEIRAASIRGSSVRGEFGMRMDATKDNPWSTDISIYGYGGKHRGFGGNVSVAYTF